MSRAKWLVHGLFTGNKCEYRTEQDYIGNCKGECELRTAMTAYHFDGARGSKEDPNRPFLACKEHWDQYHDHWTEMWQEYWRDRL